MTENSYLNLLSSILKEGEEKEDRTGVGVYSSFCKHLVFNFNNGFPALTTKKIAWKSIVSELLWFIEGSTDERRLAELRYKNPRTKIKDKTTIWTTNANKQGKDLGHQNNDLVKNLGPIYGLQWRNFNGNNNCDQLQYIIDQLKENPNSRRIFMSAWNPCQINEMSLPPCHVSVQFYVENNQFLNCAFYQRSADLFLGSPFNIASYSLLTYLVAREVGLKPKELNYFIGDAHIYINHKNAVLEQIARTPFCFPDLDIDENFSILDLNGKVKNQFDLDAVDKIKLINYKSHETIKAEMAA